MTAEDALRRVIDTVQKLAPSNIRITSVEFEGPLVAIYTEDIEVFINNVELVKNLAQSLRRRVAIRPSPSLLTDMGPAEAIIRKQLPEGAEIGDIHFDPVVGEVIIEAINPGLAIGKHGMLLNDIKKKIGWMPKVVRKPPIPSKTVKEVRSYMRKVSDERIEILRKIGRRLNRSIEGDENWVRLSTLGGYREVGRSCHLLSTKHSKILVDVGVNVASIKDPSPHLNAPEAMPFDNIDAIIITHAHLDHCGLVPLLYKYGYDGPVYCTPPTRDLASLLQLDYLKVAASEGAKIPYESAHIRQMIKHCIPLKYGETTDITPDIRLTLHNAGHILGSSIVHLHVGDGLYNIAITGDIKFERTWLFNPCCSKFPRLETLVMESTYGGKHDLQPGRQRASETLKDIVQATIKKGGKVIMPVFAVGRSQEVMLVLEQYMRNKEIDKVPIYLDGMISEATAIHTAYPEYLNNRLRTQIFQQGDNPFLSDMFNSVDTKDDRERILDDTEPCIVLATSGMMNGGPIMEYLKNWSDNEKNCLIFVGYQVEGTMGRRIQKGLKDLDLMVNGKRRNIQINMDVETVDGFSGHSDRKQLLAYVQRVQPKPNRLIVMHGEESKALDIAKTTNRRYGIKARAPMNLETIRFI